MIGTRLLNRYEVISELGRGGMGVVYRARDPLLNRDVAVKLIPPSLLSAEMEERFQREAQVVAQMNHPAIVSIFDIGRHEGSLFFLMPVVAGNNLRRFFTEKARSVGDVVEIGIRVAEALEYSHARGVIHRDIKPENVMIAEEEGALRVYVMDFGLAKASSENRLTKTGALVGTVAYFSPEQVISREVDSRSDVYSLGVVLYECLAGEAPFTGEVQALLYRIAHDQPRPLRSLGVGISQELEEIILCCLQKDPARRYQRASELAAALRRCQSRLADSEKSVVLSTVMTAQIRRLEMAALVNREKEFAELQRRLNSAQDGRCQFVAIGGEPGIGKTRLVEELEALARARKIRVVHGRFVEESRGFPYQAFCGLIQDYFRSAESASSPGSWSDLSDVAGELVDVFPALSEISAIKSAASVGHAAGARRDDKTYIYELLARALTRITAWKPMLVTLENLHAAESSLEALQYVIQRLETTPVLIVGTYRQTEIHKGHQLTRLIDALADDPRFASIVLGPLSPSQHQEFLATVVGARELSASLVQRIYKATEGNPFFTRELVRALMESGGIVRDSSGAWTLSGEMAISSDALPATIQQTVEKRVERLPEEAREVLSVASVLGKSFDFEDLEAVVEETKTLERAVDRLVAEGLIEEDRQSRGDRLAFSSGIVHDVLYSSLSRRRRRSLHRRCAEHFERRYAKRLDVIYPQLVHHYSEADEPEKTVDYGLQQARHALEAFSAEEAIQVLQLVLEFAGDREWSGDRAVEGEARLLLAQAYRMQGTLDAAMREAESAQRVFERERSMERSVDAIALAADVAWQARKSDEARRLVELGIERARAASRTDRLIALLSLGATVANLRGEYDAAKSYFEAMESLRGGVAETAAQESIPRFSWERRLVNKRDLVQALRCIRGASELMRGEAPGIQGFRIVSSHEFVLDLVEPLALLPALLAEAGSAVIPEGTVKLGSSWRDGCAGTGPFRVVDFQPGRYVELDRNPDYWRAGLPKSDRLVFHLGQTPDKIREEFLGGKLSIASDIAPADVDAFLRDPELAARQKSVPRLCIYFVALNQHSQKLADAAVRRALIHGLDIDAMVRRTLGRLAAPASGVIPPGLLGYTGTRAMAYDMPGNEAALRGLELNAAVQPFFFGQYAALMEALAAAWKARGVILNIINQTGHEYLDAVRSGSPDLVIGRWMCAVPDADYFTYDLIRRENSFLGRMVGTAEFDALIERARSDPHASVRNALYRQIEEAVAREAVLLPLFNEQAYRFVRPDVDGLTLNLSSPEVSYVI